jgi:hypothetical protein
MVPGFIREGVNNGEWFLNLLGEVPTVENGSWIYPGRLQQRRSMPRSFKRDFTSGEQ